MRKKNIEKYTLTYWFLYKYALRLHHLFYREVYTINRPRKDKKKPSIITPNHQNALMDALAILFAKNEPLVFLARSDIFKKKTIAAILYFLKILPIFRIRDGYNTLKNNEETFKHTVRVLSNKRGIVILPEGNHFGAKRLRMLKKGFARIAFATQINADNNFDLQILPTAIDYTAYDSFFTRLTVVFGTPFSIKPYYDNYKANPQIALNDITKKLSRELKKHIIHIESEKKYDECLLASAVYANYLHRGFKPTDQEKRYYTQRKVNQQLNKAEKEKNPLFNNITSKASLIKQHSKNIPHEIIGQNTGKQSIIMLLLGTLLLPLSLPGLIIYGIFWYWPIWLVNVKIKDIQFRTSVRFVLYIIQYAILLIALLIYLLCSFNLQSTLLLFTSTILTGILSIKILRLFHWNLLKVKWLLTKQKNKELIVTHINLIHNIEKLINKN